MQELRSEFQEANSTAAVQARDRIRRFICDLREADDRWTRDGSLLQDGVVRPELKKLRETYTKLLESICTSDGAAERQRRLGGVESHLLSLKPDLAAYPLAKALMGQMEADMSAIHRRL